jgi:hypothetical protein
MNAETSLKLFELTQEFIKDKSKAREFVSRLEQSVDSRFDQQKEILASKSDIAQVKQEISNTRADLIKWMFIFWIGQILAVLAIVNFILK